MNKAEFEQDLQQQLSAMVREKQPERDLWAGIELALVASPQKQKQALLVHFAGQPALTNNWQEQVAELDKAELAIKAALKNEPNNMALLKLLQNVYQQQISLIERVHSPKWSQI